MIVTGGIMSSRTGEDYALTGQLVHTSTTTIYDPTRKAWIKRTLEYIDIGRPDAVVPADIDAQLAPDPWARENTQLAKAKEVIRRRAIARHAALQAALIAYMMEHGPSPSAELAAVTGINVNTLKMHLSQRSGTVYVRLYGADRRRTLWGLVGVHSQEAA